MKTFRVQVELTATIATMRISGLLTAERIVDAVNRYYPSLRQRSVLWDFSNADATRLSVEDLAIIALAARKYPPRKGERHTAFVASDPDTFARIANYLDVALMLRVATEYRIFADEATARAWLQASG